MAKKEIKFQDELQPTPIKPIPIESEEDFQERLNKAFTDSNYMSDPTLETYLQRAPVTHHGISADYLKKTPEGTSIENLEPFGGLQYGQGYFQSGWEQAGVTIPRIIGKVGFETSKIPGYLGGAAWAGATALTDGIKDNPEVMDRLLNNAWITALENAEKYVNEDVLPVYKNVREGTGNLGTQIFSPSFWATEGADGIGFFLSMLVPGAALKAVKFGARIANIANPWINSAAKSIKPATNLAARTGSKLANQIDFFSGSLVNTLFESAAEAGQTFDEIGEYLGGMTDEQGNPLYTPEEIRTRQAENAAEVMKKNFLVLLGPNMLMQANLFRSGTVLDRIAGRRLSKGLRGSNVGKMADDGVINVGKLSKWQQAGKISKRLGVTAFSEGFFEEGSQYAINEYYKQRSGESELSDEDKGVFGEINHIIDSYIDGLSNVDMQKSIFLGSLLGLVGGGIGVARETKAENVAKENFSNLINRNFTTRFRDAKNLIKTFEDEEGVIRPVLDENDNVVLDNKKVAEYLQGEVKDHLKMDQISYLENIGDETLAKYFKEQLDFNYLYPFLTQPNGVDIAKNHIKDLANLDQQAQEEVLEFSEFDNIEALQKDLLDKADRYNKIVQSTMNGFHKGRFRGVKHDKADRETFDKFYNQTIGLGLSSYFDQEHASRAIDELEKINSTLDEKKAAEKEQIEDNNELIKQYQELLDMSNEVWQKAMSPKNYQENYNNFLESEKKKDQSIKEQVDKTTKDPVAKQLTGKLKEVYDNTVMTENITGLDNREHTITHKGEFEVDFGEEIEEGKTSAIFTVDSVNKQGNLVITEKGHTSKHYLNADNTVFYKGKTYESPNVKVTKTAKEVSESRNYESALQAVNNLKSIYERRINLVNSRIDSYVNKLNMLRRKSGELLSKGRTTSKKELRKIRVPNTKDSARIYLNALEIDEYIEKIERDIEIQEGMKDRYQQSLENLENHRETLEEVGQLSKTELDNFVKNLQKSEEELSKTITNVQNLIEQNQQYTKRLRSTLKGFGTRLINLAGLSDSLQDINNNIEDGTLSTENAEILREQLVDSAYQTLKEESTNDEILENVLKNIESVKQKIELTEEELDELQERLKTLTSDIKLVKDSINKTKAFQREAIKTYFSMYKDYIDLHTGTTQVQKRKTSTPELVDKPEESPRDKYFTEKRKYDKDEDEEGAKHIFDGVESMLVSRGDQRVSDNPDNMRWYGYVLTTRDFSTSKKKSQNVFKTFTFDQVMKLDDTNPIKQQLKFYSGKTKGLVTVDQFDKLTEDEKKIVADDIKIVVVERKTGKASLTDAEGRNVGKDGTYITYTSLIAEDRLNEEVFTLNKLRNEVGKELETDKYTPTAEEVERVTQERFNKAKEELIKYRETLKKESRTLEIARKNPGVKVRENKEWTPLTKTLVGGPRYALIHDLIRIAEVPDSQAGDPTTIDVFGRKYNVLNGLVYISLQNRPEVMRPKNFGDLKMVDDLTNLLGWVLDSKNFKDPDYKAVRDYLEDTIYMNYADNPEATNYQYSAFFNHGFTNAGVVNKQHIKEFVFAGESINSKEFKENPDKVEKLKNFLAKKNHNVSKQSLNKKTSYTWFKFKDNKPLKIIHSKDNGGYYKYLFDGDKFEVPVRPVGNTPVTMAQPENTQYLNPSIQFRKAGTKITDQSTVLPSEAIEGGARGVAMEDMISKVSQGEKITDEDLAKVQGKKPSPEDSKKRSKKKADFSSFKGKLSKERQEELKKKLDKTIEEEEDKTKPVKEEDKPSSTSATLFGQTDVNDVSQKYDQPTGNIPTTDLKPFDELPKNKQEKLIQISGSVEKARKTWNSRIKSRSREFDRSFFRYTEQDFFEELAWFEEKFPNIPLEVIADRLLDNPYKDNTKDSGQFFHGLKVLVSAQGNRGTLYHEAWHVVSDLMLSPETKEALYKETRKRLDNDNLTADQIEEILADDFMDFMINPEYSFTKSESQKKNLFQRIWETIKNFVSTFYGRKVDSRIELYNYIKNNKFDALYPTKLDKIRSKVADLSAEESTYFLKDINYVFFNEIQILLKLY